MSYQRTSSHNHRPTNVSTTDHHARAPNEIFALIGNGRIFVTIAPYGWRTYIRRENPDEYTVRYENAAGVRSGTLSLNRRDARRLVTETCCEAVWIYLQDRTEWPSDEEAVDGGETR